MVRALWFALFPSLAVVFCCLGLINLLANRPWDRVESGLTVDAPHKTFESLESGEIGIVVFNLSNQTRNPVTIVGATGICYSQACLLAQDLPVVIPPGSMGPVRVKVFARLVGEFSGGISLFTDCKNKAEFALQVSGSVRSTPTTNMR